MKRVGIQMKFQPYYFIVYSSAMKTILAILLISGFAACNGSGSSYKTDTASTVRQDTNSTIRNDTTNKLMDTSRRMVDSAK